MHAHRRGSPGFTLIEAVVLLGLVAAVAAAAVPALHGSVTAQSALERRVAAGRAARNVLVRARAATAYDAGEVASLGARAPVAWSLSVPEARTGRSLAATVAAAASDGTLSVTVSLQGVQITLSEELRAQAPPPGAVLDPAGY